MKSTDFRKAVIIHDMATPVSPFPACQAEEVYVLNNGYSISIDKVQFDNAIGYLPKDGDKIYFHPKCNVVRDKVRTWGKLKNLSITTDINKANAEFVDKQTVQGYLTRPKRQMYAYKHDDVTGFLTANYGKDMDIIINMIRNCQSETVYLSRKIILDNNEFIERKDKNGVVTNADKIKRANIVKPLNHFAATPSPRWELNYATPKQFTSIQDLLYSTKVRSVASLIDQLNENLIAIDQEMYDQLKTMLQSKDEADMTVAIECLANCNLQKSMGRVILLLKDHWRHISKYRAAKHANFKSLLSFLNLPNLTRITYDDMVESMMSYGYLTKETLFDLMPIIKEQMKKKADSKHFTIKTVTCSEEIVQPLAPHLKPTEPKTNIVKNE